MNWIVFKWANDEVEVVQLLKMTLSNSLLDYFEIGHVWIFEIGGLPARNYVLGTVCAILYIVQTASQF